MKPFLRLLLFINYCFIHCSWAFAETKFIDSFERPSGFENVPINENIGVSVLFHGKNIGDFYVRIHKNKLQFHSPTLLLSRLPGIHISENLSDALAQPFSLNTECYSQISDQLPDTCPGLNSESVYIIYHPQQESVYLYLTSSSFAKPLEENTIEFIPQSFAGPSYINKVGAIFSFANDRDLSLLATDSPTSSYYNLYSNNIVAYKNNSLIGNISYNSGLSDDRHFQIQNLYTQHICQDKIYNSGYLLSSFSPFFQTQMILGVGMKTTLETIKNSDEIATSPLVVFIQQAGQVNFFKNDQLIFSQFLEAGYHRINTDNFPEGGYELTVRAGSENILRRFFTKGFLLPPPLAPQYYILAGYLTNGMLSEQDYDFLPSVLGIPVFQMGVAKRIGSNVAFLGDILLTSHQSMIDFGPIFFLGNTFIKTAGLISTKNNYGIYTLLNSQKDKLSLNLIATKIIYQDVSLDNFFLDNIEDNHSASISYSLTNKDAISIYANYNKALEQIAFYSVGSIYQKQIGYYQNKGFFLNAGYNKTFHSGSTYNLSLGMNFTHGHFSGSEALWWQNQHKEPHHLKVSPISIQGSTIFSNQNEYELGHAFSEIHSISANLFSVAGTYNYADPLGFVAGYVNYSKNKSEKSITGFGGNIETEVAFNHKGGFLNSKDRMNGSGFTIEVKSTDKNDIKSNFAILDENNRKIAHVAANKKVFVSAPSFTDQNFTLVNLSKTHYHVQEPTRRITLYPGNVPHYTWRAEKRVIVIGRLSYQGNALANTWIQSEKNGIFTDSEGYFQLELAQDTKMLITHDQCQIHLPKLMVDKAYVYIGDISCSYAN